MSKKLTKEKVLKLQVAELSRKLEVSESNVFRLSSVVNEIKRAVAGSGYRSDSVSTDELAGKVWRMAGVMEFFQGRNVPERDHILSLEKILRWTINPESAKDDEKIERFEEMRRKGML